MRLSLGRSAPGARPIAGRPRRQLGLAIGLLLLAAFGYLCFELGRYWAGYSVLDQHRALARVEERLAAQTAAAEELRRELAIASTSREIDRETYAQVEANLAQLESTIQAQEEELAFYRGIVSPQDGNAGLRIQALEILPGDRERRYLLRLVLVQAIVHSRRVSGIVKLRLEGSLAGQSVELGLEKLVGEGAAGGDLAYDFRYFQALERDLLLPEGFEPATVRIEVWPSEPRGDRLTQAFSWAVRG